jgi:hypothetical protein
MPPTSLRERKTAEGHANDGRWLGATGPWRGVAIRGVAMMLADVQQTTRSCQNVPAFRRRKSGATEPAITSHKALPDARGPR